MERDFELSTHFGPNLAAVLEQISDALLVLDENRSLRFVNERARRILGYEAGEVIGGRCRHTTRGVDCSDSCPLTFVLEGGLDSVQQFRTVYHTRDGDPVPLEVTVVPLLNEDGGFGGAVEILRPTEPDPGFYSCGRSVHAEALRRAIGQAAQHRRPVALVGEAIPCLDVAAAIHRFSGLPDDLFLLWPGSWEGVASWPAGSVYHRGPGLEDVNGWRVILGAPDTSQFESEILEGMQVIQLPDANDLADDLPMMLRRWVEQHNPQISVTGTALAQLCQMTRDRGFDELESILMPVLETSKGRLKNSDLTEAPCRSVFIDEILRADDPLAALEHTLLSEVLEQCEWKMQDAADRLGVSRVTLWRKLKDHGIERP